MVSRHGSCPLRAHRDTDGNGRAAEEPVGVWECPPKRRHPHPQVVQVVLSLPGIGTWYVGGER
jgi:hypothetical protein